METLIAEIDAFCSAHGIAETRFGLLAMNDKSFLRQLRGDRDIKMSTVDRVRRFMAEYPAQQADAA